MRPDDSASRLTVGITTILTIVFLLGYTNAMLPKVILCYPFAVTEQSPFDVMRRSSSERADAGDEKNARAGTGSKYIFASRSTFKVTI